MHTVIHILRQWQSQRESGENRRVNAVRKTIDEPLKPNENKDSRVIKKSVKGLFWHCTVPLCLVILYSITCWTAIHIKDGSLSIKLEFTVNSQIISIDLGNH